MIQKLSRDKIDIHKYNQCITDAMNSKVYAMSYYLDALNNKQWFCFVLNDYQAVMPVCFVKKMGIKVIIQPTYCQQLGVFYAKPISEENFNEFIMKLKKNIVKSYSFNDKNTEYLNFLDTQRINYMLDLNDSYEKIYINYNQNIKRKLKKAERIHLDFSSQKINHSLIENYIQTKIQNQPQISLKTLEKLKNLLYLLQHYTHIEMVEVKNNTQILSMAIFIESQNTLYYINGTNSIEAKKYESSVFLFDNYIQLQSQQNKKIDFEGSNIKGVAQFFKGFGAYNKPFKSIIK